MTKLLQKAFEAAAQLPDQQQDELASMLLQEIASEQKWDAAFARSQDALAKLAREALAEHAAGRTAPLNHDRDLEGH
ncbi:MAG: hypothetical protein ACT4O5_14905 [Gammaproteobacteria bacterium]